MPPVCPLYAPYMPPVLNTLVGGLKVALVWLWGRIGFPIGCLPLAYQMALGWLWGRMGWLLPRLSPILPGVARREGGLGHWVFSQTPGSGLEHGAVETARGTGRRGFQEVKGAVRRVIGADGDPGRQVRGGLHHVGVAVGAGELDLECSADLAGKANRVGAQQREKLGGDQIGRASCRE